MTRFFRGSIFSLKLSLASMFITLITLVVLNALTYHRSSESINNFINSRFVVLAHELENTILTGLNLGLPFRGLDGIQAQLETVKKTDPQVVAISVFESDETRSGRVLFNTRQAAIGGNVPLSWLERMRLDYGEYWSFLDDDIMNVGITLKNSFGHIIGGVVIRYDQSYTQIQLNRLLKKMLLLSCLLFIISSVLIFAINYTSFTHTGHSFYAMTHHIQSLLYNRPQPDLAYDPNLVPEFQNMISRIQTLFDTLNDIEQTIQIEHSDEPTAA